MLKKMELYGYAAWLVALVLGVLMFLGDLIGHRMRTKRANTKSGKSIGLGPLEGSLLGLLSLLLSFTFQMAAQRYDQRRIILIEETNRIGTALPRSDLFQKDEREVVRLLFKDYIKSRISYFDAGTDRKKIQKTILEAERISKELWRHAVSGKLIPQERILVIGAYNEMIDVVTMRDSMREAVIPDSILWLLFILSFLSSIVIGYCTDSRLLDSIIAQAFTVVVCLTIFIILDLDRPRRGFINLKSEEKHLAGLLKDFDR